MIYRDLPGHNRENDPEGVIKCCSMFYPSPGGQLKRLDYPPFEYIGLFGTDIAFIIY